MDVIIEFLKKPITIIFIGALIVAIGGTIAAIGTFLHNRGSSEKSSNILTGVKEGIEIGKNTGSNIEGLKVQNVELINKVDDQLKTIDDLRKENTDLYGKLQEASKTIFENIKGGQEVIYLQASPMAVGNYEFLIKNYNTLPVYGLTFEMLDYDEAIKCKSVSEGKKYFMDHKCFRKFAHGFGIHQLEIGTMLLSVNDPFFANAISKEYGRYQVRFRTRDNLFFQEIVYKKIGNKIDTTSRIYKGVNPNNGEYDFVEVMIIKPVLPGWEVDFDKEFPTGLITNYITLE